MGISASSYINLVILILIKRLVNNSQLQYFLRGINSSYTESSTKGLFELSVSCMATRQLYYYYILPLVELLDLTKLNIYYLYKELKELTNSVSYILK